MRVPSLTSPLGRAIEESGYRKEYVARRAHMEPWTLSRLIASTRAPTKHEAELLAAVLDRKLEQLFPDGVAST
jgi:hypothetical protein